MQATSPMDPCVLDAMIPYMIELYAKLINADPKEIIFSYDAIESNNTSIKGVAKSYNNKKKHIITTQTVKSLQQEGFDVTHLPVQSNGLIDLNQLEETIHPDTSIVSIMTVNNEIGVMQPIDAIAAQAAGKVPLYVNTMNIDRMSISGHKLYGSKGVGALYVCKRPRARLEAVQSGSGQERDIRNGTVPYPLVVGLGEACKVVIKEIKYDHQRISKLSKRLIDGIQSKAEHVYRNGDPVHSYPGCVNLSFAYVEGEPLIMVLKNIALSSGSACTSASLEPSYMLRGLGTDDEMAHSSIRFGIGRFTTEEETEFVINKVSQHVDRLREISSLWEIVQKELLM
ncbi:hypothetical protein G6F43_000875 [Rhizopus delemar]|nr:hypothetical protein G6F43_000875 [Rhizopus delemar]